MVIFKHLVTKYNLILLSHKKYAAFILCYYVKVQASQHYNVPTLSIITPSCKAKMLHIYKHRIIKLQLYRFKILAIFFHLP